MQKFECSQMKQTQLMNVHSSHVISRKSTFNLKHYFRQSAAYKSNVLKRKFFIFKHKTSRVQENNGNLIGKIAEIPRLDGLCKCRFSFVPAFFPAGIIYVLCIIHISFPSYAFGRFVVVVKSAKAFFASLNSALFIATCQRIKI